MNGEREGREGRGRRSGLEGRRGLRRAQRPMRVGERVWKSNCSGAMCSSRRFTCGAFWLDVAGGLSMKWTAGSARSNVPIDATDAI